MFLDGNDCVGLYNFFTIFFFILERKMVIILLQHLLNIHTDQSNYALTILANM